MSECVVRMEMPGNCYECEMRGAWAFCPIGKWPVVGYKKQRHEDYPIICQLPKGHGDLVDWNNVEKELEATFAGYVDDVARFDNGQPGFLRRKVYPDALMIRPIKAQIIIPEEGGKENK